MTFSTERAIKAIRKSRPCWGCRRNVEVGEPAIGWAGNIDGDFSSGIYHPECRKAEIALNELYGGGWSDWVPLADIDFDEHEWLLAEYPDVAVRFGITDATTHDP